MGGGSEVCLSVVESVLIDVVDDHAGRDFDYAAVHKVGEIRFVIASWACSLGIICAGGLVFDDVPFVPAESPVIFGVNDGVFAFSEGYSSEGIAVADAAVEQQGPNEGGNEEGGDVKSYFDECEPFFHFAIYPAEDPHYAVGNWLLQARRLPFPLLLLSHPPSSPTISRQTAGFYDPA